MASILIPPWIQPQAESVTLVDDSTSVFRGAYAPGVAQRVSYVEPRLQVKQSFKSLRAQDRALMLSALKRAQGKFGTVRAAVGYALRGSFPTGELMPNPTFANGTTGVSAFSSTTLSVTDRILRAKATAAQGQRPAFFQNATVTPFVPYVGRAVLNGFSGFSLTFQTVDPQVSKTTAGAVGMNALSFVPLQSPMSVELFNSSIAGAVAGSYADVSFMSIAQCALVDGGVNLVSHSDDFDNAYWTKVNGTITPNNTIAPDGTQTADAITETTATGQHEIDASSKISCSAATNLDYCLTIAIQGGLRSWMEVLLNEDTGSSSLGCYINLSTGALGTTFTGTNWANLRTSVSSLGNNWWQLSIVGTKTSVATTLSIRLLLATANGTNSYTGSSSSVAASVWRATVAQSSVPCQLTQTTGSVITASPLSAGGIDVKGLPASTNGLLLVDDLVEINGELKSVTASLDSDGNGLGFLSFAPAMSKMPNDNDPVVITQPFGKFILADNASWTNDYGVYADVDIALEAIVE
jgi:hypothetical protein